MMEEPEHCHKNQNAVVQPLLTGLFLFNNWRIRRYFVIEIKLREALCVNKFTNYVDWKQFNGLDLFVLNNYNFVSIWMRSLLTNILYSISGVWWCSEDNNNSIVWSINLVFRDIEKNTLQLQSYFFRFRKP